MQPMLYQYPLFVLTLHTLHKAIDGVAMTIGHGNVVMLRQTKAILSSAASLPVSNGIGSASC